MVIQVRYIFSAGAKSAPSDRNDAQHGIRVATLQHLPVVMPAQADGMDCKEGTGICGTSAVGPTAGAVLPGVAKEQLQLHFEFEARKGTFGTFLKYIKIDFAGGVFQPLLIRRRVHQCSEH